MKNYNEIKNLSEEELKKVTGGVSLCSNEEMNVVVIKFLNDVTNEYTSWVKKNPSSSEAEKVYKYNEIIEKIFNSLSIHERQLIEEYLNDMNE